MYPELYISAVQSCANIPCAVLIFLLLRQHFLLSGYFCANIHSLTILVVQTLVCDDSQQV